MKEMGNGNVDIGITNEPAAEEKNSYLRLVLVAVLSLIITISVLIFIAPRMVPSDRINQAAEPEQANENTASSVTPPTIADREAALRRLPSEAASGTEPAVDFKTRKESVNSAADKDIPTKPAVSLEDRQKSLESLSN